MITFKVTPDDGEPYEVTAGSRDVYRWEKTGRGRSFAQFQSDLRMTSMYELAHAAATRQGLYTSDLTAFIDAHELETVAARDEDDEGRDPTRPAP
ncbi:MAG TPA: hypothetical protein VGD67_13785 [Pseudonocardiaceae bacterium]